MPCHTWCPGLQPKRWNPRTRDPWIGCSACGMRSREAAAEREAEELECIQCGKRWNIAKGKVVDVDDCDCGLAYVVVGNTHQLGDGDQRHRWKLYVEGRALKQVEVFLHPTFKENHRVITAPPFEMSAVGWGTFEVALTLHTHAGGKIKTVWDLQFERPNAKKAICIRGERANTAMDQGQVAEAVTGDELGPVGVDVDDSKHVVEEREATRHAISSVLQKVQFLEHTHELFMHGRGYQGPLEAPRATWVCEKPPRDNHSCPKWLTATEFCDDASVSRAKIKQLAALMRVSRKTVLYTGAGISAAVVGQAARSGQNTVGFKASPLLARPTPTHFALGFLGLQGLIHSWVQQNHDGLPQKAGFPQERINEIHGSWFDPSNPVVRYDGRLPPRAYPWMHKDALMADLVLVLGTSLGGLTADQMATEAAKRSCKTGQHSALGTVCINLQQTAEDGKMTLRFFGKSDDILKELLLELGFSSVPTQAPSWPSVSHALVPYDGDGRRLLAGERRRMWLDLRDHAKVRITPGHNIQGAKQPVYMHIGASKPVVFSGKTVDPAPGNGTVLRRELDHFLLNIEGRNMELGVWWLVSAMNGGVEVLPAVNQNPTFETA
mmetsp:Transcript_53842/g.149752  ORF Transcript_53842/g.149752 Transcript_53842/m.149752 type:complete len:607 (-) Transcript_53842:146-1966(-)